LPDATRGSARLRIAIVGMAFRFPGNRADEDTLWQARRSPLFSMHADPHLFRCTTVALDRGCRGY